MEVAITYLSSQVNFSSTKSKFLMLKEFYDEFNEIQKIVEWTFWVLKKSFIKFKLQYWLIECLLHI